MGTKYQPAKVRDGIAQDVERLEKQSQSGADSTAVMVSPEAVKKRLRKRKALLNSITPPEVSGAEKDRLIARKKQLEQALKEGVPERGIPKMPTQRQMMDNPDGSTNAYLKWERTWANMTLNAAGDAIVKAENGYGAKFELKDILQTLNRDASADDVEGLMGSLEYLRADAPEPLMNMHLPVSFGLTNKARENYDSIFPDHIPTENEVAAGEYTREEREQRLATSRSEDEEDTSEEFSTRGKITHVGGPWYEVDGKRIKGKTAALEAAGVTT